MATVTANNCLHLPSPVVAIALAPSAQLGVASEDGTVRLYQPPYSKVSKAMRNLGCEISSLVFSPGGGDIWVACGQRALCFSLETPQMIMEQRDAKLEIRLTDGHEDVLNEITIKGSHLAYTLDSGAVGVLDLNTREQKRMETIHTNLCTNVSFIPDRPRELVSGGYDSTLLHFDFELGSLLSSLKIAGPSEPSARVSLSPPFVLSLSIAQTGLVACGLADGRAWLGAGGEKTSSSEGSSNARKKKRRKWHGLRIDDGEFFKIAEGPIIAVSFSSSIRLLTLTLLGTLTLHEIQDGHIRRSIWTTESSELAKANALAVNGSLLVVGGVDSKNKGVVHSWSVQECEQSPS